MLIKTTRVLIVRDSKTKTAVCPMLHELPILQALHGVNNILPLEGESEPREIDETVEAERLAKRYGNEVVAAVFGGLAAAVNIAKALKENEAKSEKAKKASKTEAE